MIQQLCLPCAIQTPKSCGSAFSVLSRRLIFKLNRSQKQSLCTGAPLPRTNPLTPRPAASPKGVQPTAVQSYVYWWCIRAFRQQKGRSFGGFLVRTSKTHVRVCVFSLFLIRFFCSSLLALQRQETYGQ